MRPANGVLSPTEQKIFVQFVRYPDAIISLAELSHATGTKPEVCYTMIHNIRQKLGDRVLVNVVAHEARGWRLGPGARRALDRVRGARRAGAEPPGVGTPPDSPRASCEA